MNRSMDNDKQRQITTAQVERLRARRRRATLQGRIQFERVLELDQQIRQLQATLAELVPATKQT